MLKNCEGGLENTAQGHRLRVAFSRLRSQFFTIWTDPEPVDNIFIFLKLDAILSERTQMI